MSYISYTDIMNHIDIDRDDFIYIASDIKKLVFMCMRNNENFDANLFIDSIKDKISDEGTIVFPTYNWDFCKGTTFDYTKTPSQTGALSNVALKREDFSRTLHPIYSFAVYGKHQKTMLDFNNKAAWGEDTPFEFMCKKNAKALFLGLDVGKAFTFKHHIEKLCNVPYRYEKDFSSEYIDKNGNKSIKTYSFFVRKLEKKVDTFLVGDALEAIKSPTITKSYLINGIPIYLLDINKACEIVRRDIYENGAKSLHWCIDCEA